MGSDPRAAASAATRATPSWCSGRATAETVPVHQVKPIAKKMMMMEFARDSSFSPVRLRLRGEYIAPRLDVEDPALGQARKLTDLHGGHSIQTQQATGDQAHDTVPRQIVRKVSIVAKSQAIGGQPHDAAKSQVV